MKRNIILLFSIYCSIMAYAQKEYDSFLKEGKVWRMEYKQVVYEGESYQDKIIMLSGDTLIDDIPFRRMLEKRWMRGIQDEPKDWKATYGYIGEKDGKVYYWHNSYPTTPQIVMDFSLNEGDNVVGSQESFTLSKPFQIRFFPGLMTNGLVVVFLYPSRTEKTSIVILTHGLKVLDLSKAELQELKALLWQVLTQSYYSVKTTTYVFIILKMICGAQSIMV